MAELILRKATAKDSEFAYQTRKAAFRGYVEQVGGWNEEEQRQLHEHRFLSPEVYILQASDVAVGILALVRAPDHLRLNQLFILPGYQGKGYGRACMCILMAEAEAAKVPIHLKVLKGNHRAITFYQRLGFTGCGETDTHALMERRCAMERCDYRAPWYHGSPERLTMLRQGSWVSQFKELAKAFSHKPALISMGDDNQTVKHNGQQPGFLYVIAEPVSPDTVSYHPHTALTHWQTQRDVHVQLICELPIDDPPQLSTEEVAVMRRRLPEGKTGFISDRDEG